MTYREKTSTISLLTIVLVYAAYGVWLLQGPHSIAETLIVLIGGVALMVIVALILTALYSATRGIRTEAEDERDRQIGQKSTRNAYWVVLCVLWAIPILALLGPRTWTATALVLTLGLAEMVHYGSRIFYYRRGV